MIRLRTALLMLGASALTACNLAPTYVRSVSQSVPQGWPSGAAYAPAAAGKAGMPWRSLVRDEKLRTVIERALANNQDLAAAVANVASARALYRVQRSAQLPTLSADGSASLAQAVGGGTATSGSGSLFSGNVGISGFELDLFGRQKNLSQAAFETYLGTQSGARSTRFAVVTETASAYLTFAADRDLLTVSQDQVQSSARTVRLNEELHDTGLVNGADVADARTLLAQAQADAAQRTTQVAQDRNALELLVGGPVEDALLPASLAALDPAIANVPAGLSSTVLLDRPDVVEAEHQLKSANADVGAARAAFFPTISLTSVLGLASTALTGLFSGATWTTTPSASIPILGGTNRGNLDYARAQVDYYLATYRKAAQTAYRDVADGLARRGTIDRQRRAQADLVTAAQTSYRISEARYREGTDSFLTTLVAQRTLYSARQTAITATLTDLVNRVTLYQAIGSDDTL
ncbi:efflux transporter outer membrane subunit [Sphingomonas prati]|uniref:Multidrug efflux system outer membrane protein n=1 Tax=Sphingomonas prati TaxID=1843237 RepID=A0A7W9BVB4_9SPHN|nr:efflux transporter outer membrane subunit [Sphingomonas prati]MBB5730328.1 multidrug efflux system outer membrane protein [Sphingomonas prati]GGE93259.1 multidrug transporter [Sphingomonas prati]